MKVTSDPNKPNKQLTRIISLAKTYILATELYQEKWTWTSNSKKIFSAKTILQLSATTIQPFYSLTDKHKIILDNKLEHLTVKKNPFNQDHIMNISCCNNLIWQSVYCLSLTICLLSKTDKHKIILDNKKKICLTHFPYLLAHHNKSAALFFHWLQL